jgi:DNA-directed RNA polymerase specialized sigma subunit
LAARREPEFRLTREQQKLAADNLNLAREIAWRYQRSTGIDFSILQSAAFEGLCQAAAKYDGSRISARTNRTMKFSSLAVPYIRGAILHYIRDRTYSMRLSHRMRELWVKGRRMALEGATDEQVHARLGIEAEEWQDVKLACSGPPLELKDHSLPGKALEPDETFDLSSYEREAEALIESMPPALRRQLEAYSQGRLRRPPSALAVRFRAFVDRR